MKFEFTILIFTRRNPFQLFGFLFVIPYVIFLQVIIMFILLQCSIDPFEIIIKLKIKIKVNGSRHWTRLSFISYVRTSYSTNTLTNARLNTFYSGVPSFSAFKRSRKQKDISFFELHVFQADLWEEMMFLNPTLKRFLTSLLMSHELSRTCSIIKPTMSSYLSD